MLRVFSSSKELYIGKIMMLYSEEREEFSQNTLKTEQDFYRFVIDFLKDKHCCYWVWEIDGVYVAAMRTEPYRDGILLTGLVTEPAFRRKGYAKLLITQTVQCLKEQNCKVVYSHIQKDNIPSSHTHYACGFKLLHQHAVLLDGSVNSHYYTFSYEL